ncbi:hypothetical protein [Hoeflea sp.]|uniref:hypothetical protein n=1 Tax=Hoeflea sp. TaxID=1940281 RepID=UPI003BB14C51
MTKTFRVLDFLLVGSSTLMGGFAGAAIASGLGPFENLEWETLVAGSMAVFAAFYTVQQMQNSERLADSRHNKSLFVQTLPVRLKIERVRDRWPRRLRRFARVTDELLTAANDAKLDQGASQETRAKYFRIVFNSVRDFGWTEANGMPEDMLTPELDNAVADFRSWLDMLGDVFPREISLPQVGLEPTHDSAVTVNGITAAILGDASTKAEELAEAIDRWSEQMLGG